MKKLKEAGVEATVETDILSSAAAREKAAGYEVAVLIAQVRRSAYDTLEQDWASASYRTFRLQVRS